MHLEAWLIGIVLVIGGVLVVSHLGVDLGTDVSSLLNGIAHALGRPL